MVALSLGACGGGGGGGDSDPTASVMVGDYPMLVMAVQGEAAPVGYRPLSFHGVAADQAFVQLSFSGAGVSAMEFVPTGPGHANLYIQFADPATLEPWSYDGEVSLRVCHDAACSREVGGKPLRFQTTYVVRSTIPPEPQPDPDPSVRVLRLLDRAELGHDVVDAEYSASLDAIVMVSSGPENALHVYYPASGIRHSVPLSRVPTAVSVAPDGRSAAVGHDGMISHVELERLGDTLPPAPVEWAASGHVFDLVLDGRGRAHAIPLLEPRELMSIDVATGTERLSQLSFYQQRGALHPSGDYLYLGNETDLWKIDVRPDEVQKVTINWGTYQRILDGKFWFSEDGSFIYTLLFEVYTASADPDKDQLFVDRYRLSFQDVGRIESLSHSSEAGEIMLVEKAMWDFRLLGPCEFAVWAHPCNRRLAIYDDVNLSLVEVYSIPPIEIGERSYAQESLFVFHSSNGAHRYMLSRTPGAPADPHFLSVLR
jgi:hypothetical protein